MPIEEKIHVATGSRCYDITVRSGLLQHLESCDQYFTDHAVVVSDNNVAAHYLNSTTDQLKTFVARVDSIVIDAGEKSKSIEVCGRLWEHLLAVNTDRQSTIVALGGGVVGDLAGFVAATYARGIPVIQMPTSLLAQVDSSVGGKTGINLSSAKNMAGAFWQPKAVLIDPGVLSTLDEANYCSGLAEVVKYGVIVDADFFQFLQDHSTEINSRHPAILTKIISHCCQLKADVVGQDEREQSGRRAILNYGHTFGHAIENVFEYGTFLHGEAVAIGMQCAARLARALKNVDNEFVQQQAELLSRFRLPRSLSEADQQKTDELVSAMHRDKKVAGGNLILVLPTGIGQVELIDSPGDDLLKLAFLDR